MSAGLLFAAGSLAAQEEEDDSAPVETPAPVMPPGDSIVRFETSISLAEMVRSLEERVPRTFGSPENYVAYNDTLEVRYLIERDSLKLELDGYDFVLNCTGRYWLYTRARGIPDFGEAHCGSADEPIGITFGYHGRLGWVDGWRLGMRLTRTADVFSMRCKPKPPSHNFTRFIERNIQKNFQDPLGAAFVEEMARFDALQPMVEAVWKGLSETQDLFNGQVWLDWHPGPIEADPAGGKGENLEIRLSAVVEPVIRVGERGTSVPDPLPEPVVRVADEFARIPVDIVLSLDTMGDHILERLRSAEKNPFQAVGGIRIGGEGERLQVEILPVGAASPGARLIGSFVFDPERQAIETQQLEWAPGSPEILASRFSGLDPVLFLDRMKRELAFDVKEELLAKKQLLPKAVNRTLAGNVSSRGAILGFVAEKPAIVDSTLLLRHWAFGPVWISVGESSN